MNDSYVECLVKRKPNPLNILIKGVIYAATVTCAILALSGLVVMFVPVIGLGLLIYFWMPNLDLEFEYLYLDKEISIDKVMNKQKRKRVVTLDLNKMEFIAPETSHELDSYKSRNLKIKDFSSKDPEVKKQILVYNGTSGTELYCIEPNGELLKCIKTVFPRKIREF